MPGAGIYVLLLSSYNVFLTRGWAILCLSKVVHCPRMSQMMLVKLAGYVYMKLAMNQTCLNNHNHILGLHYLWRYLDQKFARAHKSTSKVLRLTICCPASTYDRDSDSMHKSHRGVGWPLANSLPFRETSRAETCRR